jgi:hypothetical protein
LGSTQPQTTKIKPVRLSVVPSHSFRIVSIVFFLFLISLKNFLLNVYTLSFCFR